MPHPRRFAAMMTSPLADKVIPINLLFLRNYPILHQLQLEEALLRVDERNWCLINIGSPPAIVMGISGQPESLIDKSLMAERPVSLIRRFSGGGTVFVDSDTLFVTWICNAVHSAVPCCPAKVHHWMEGVYQSALPSIKIRLRENDYVIGDRKCGGNAQYFRKQRWLHHSTLLWDYNPDNMRYLLKPLKMPKYREGRSHEAFLCRLSDFLPAKTALEEMLAEALYRHFYVHEVALESALKAVEKEHRKATRIVDFEKDC